MSTDGLVLRGSLSDRSVLRDYWTLTKPDVNLLILMTTAAGFFLARSIHLDGFPIPLLVHALVGTLLVASGTASLNQYVERRFDARMRRTKRRPLAAGRIHPERALWFGITLSAVGAAYLIVATNVLAGLIAVLTALSYLLIYTPLKRKTPLCTLAGAFSGAAPPLIGWAAASGALDLEAWILYGFVFLWQFPHFMAIAWMYREDYERAEYRVLPSGKSRSDFMVGQVVLPSLGLIAASAAPMLLGRGHLFCIAINFLLSGWFFYFGTRLVLHQGGAEARRLLLASIIYLPMLLALMVLETL